MSPGRVPANGGSGAAVTGRAWASRSPFWRRLPGAAHLPGATATSAEGWIAAVLVAVLGCGLAIALGGAARGAVEPALAGGAMAAVALVLLVATGWLEPLGVVALAVPLPAVFESDALRIAAAAPVTAAVVLGCVLRWGVGGAPLRTGLLPRQALLGLAAALVLATVAATDPAGSVRELLNLALLGALLLIAVDAFDGHPGRLRSTFDLLIALAAACGVLAALEAVAVIPGDFPRWGTPFYRAALGFGQPNGLGLFFALILPLAAQRVHGAASAGGRLAAGIAVGAIVTGLLATFSRGAWLSVVGGTAALLLTRDYRFVLRIWLIAAAVAVAADVASGGALRDTVERTIDDWVIEQRAALMYAGVLMFLQRPVLGVGPGGFADNLDRLGAQIPQLWDYLPTPHNAYIQMAAETGVVGLIAFIVFFGVVLRTLVRRVRAVPDDSGTRRAERRALLWSFATLGCACWVVWPFAHGAGQAAVLVLAAAFARDGGGEA